MTMLMHANDHTVSGERFEIWECANCTARFTQDVPSPAEIGRYYQSEKYISHSNTNKGLVNRLYHRIRKVTLAQKRNLIKKATSLDTGNLLDIGAGTGLFVEAMRKAGWKVTGLEPDETARKRAREMNIVLNDISDLFKLPPASFNAITMWHVLEHVHDIHGYLSQIGKLLQPGGKLIIAVPNFLSRDALIYKEYWAAYDVPRHLYHFSPAAMRGLLEKHGFHVGSMHPQWFDSFYVSMLSEQYKTGKSNLVRATWNGLRSNFKALGSAGKCSSVIYVSSKI
ncbi:MAG TPA: class I SAM-dependent methyltransferase [Chitinophagaceae bacterium]|nr:class I SAM-dependent methyltransferase [Chitinophagaceae bacterium]